MERSVLAKRFQNLRQQAADESQIVAEFGHGLHLGQPLVVTGRGFVNVEDGVIQVFLGGEMAEQNRLAHAARRRDVLGAGAAKPVLREEGDRMAQQLPAPVVRGQARPGCRRGQRRQHRHWGCVHK